LEPHFQITPSGERWFDVTMSLASEDGEKFSASDIQRLILSGSGSTRLKNGRIALIDTGALEDFNEVLRDCAPQQHSNGYRFNNVQAAFLDATLRQQTGWRVQASSAWREGAARQSGQAKLTCPPLGPLEDVLRPYQRQGVAWLQFLRENRFGGILADEMGLGKTLQTLAFIQSCHTNRKLSGPVLIVCPTSLVFNWVLDQELPLIDEQYLAYRRRVSERIHKVQREERTMRIVTKNAWATTAVVFLIVGILDFNLERIPGSPGDLVRLSLIFPTLVCLACSTALLAFYLINYRPRLKNTEHEAMLLSLQRQLHELRSQLPQGSTQPLTAQVEDPSPKV
jgi:SNF2-related domain